MDGRGELTRPLVAICVVGFALAYARIYFGVDFGDDSFAVGVPYAFTRGARPFVDELLVQQTGSLELTPLVWLYAAVVGSADGIVLFVRHLPELSDKELELMKEVNGLDTPAAHHGTHQKE